MENYHLCYNEKEFVQSSNIVISLYILVILICFTMLFMILKYSANNMIFRERSGQSLYIQLISTSLFLLLYPVLILVKQGDTKFTFMEFQFIVFFLAIFKYIPIFVYFLRSLRFYFAFNISISIDGILFKMLKNTQASGLIIIIIPIVLLGIIETQEQFDQNLFIIHYELNQVLHTRLIMRYFSQTLLICSQYLLRKSKKIFIYDYWSALFIEGIAQLFKTLLFYFGLTYCYSQDHPLALYYFIDCLKLVFFLISSISVPFLTNHKPIADLPFEMQCTNFSFFFNESRFVKIFYQYLCHFDSKKNKLSETVCVSNFPNQINQTIIHEKSNSQQIFNYQLSKCYLLLIDLTKFYSNQNLHRHSIQNDLITYFSQPDVQTELLQVFPIQITKHLFNQINILKRMKQNSEISGALASSAGTDEEDSISNIKLFDLGWQLREIMFEQIRIAFEQEFKYTVSFKNLLFMCEQNRIIWQRLGKMNLSGK